MDEKEERDRGREGWWECLWAAQWRSESENVSRISEEEVNTYKYSHIFTWTDRSEQHGREGEVRTSRTEETWRSFKVTVLSLCILGFYLPCFLLNVSLLQATLFLFGVLKSFSGRFSFNCQYVHFPFCSSRLCALLFNFTSFCFYSLPYRNPERVAYRKSKIDSSKRALLSTKRCFIPAICPFVSSCFLLSKVKVQGDYVQRDCAEIITIYIFICTYSKESCTFLNLLVFLSSIPSYCVFLRSV